MTHTWFIARRLYSQGGNSRRASRSAIVIATAGVALGIAIMIISISVVLGFKHEVQRKVTGIGSHIQIVNYQSLYDTESLPIVISDKLLHNLRHVKGVSSAHRYCTKTGMLKTDEAFQGVMFKGIDADYDLTFLRNSLVGGEIDQPFSATASTDRLVISKTLAQQLHLSVGSRLYAYFFDETLRARRFTVAAIYETNLTEYDSRLVFCDMHTIHRLLDYEADQSSGAEVCLSGMDYLPMVSERVQRTVNHQQDRYGAPYSSPTIRDQYPHIFAWLDLLDLNVIVILVLMLAVAGFTTISGLLIIILERTQFIGVMKALGAANRPLRHIFLWYALMLVVRGLLVGNLLGIGLCLVQQHFGLVHLDAATYYVDRVPVLISWSWVLIINVGTLLLSTLALLLPTLLVSRIRPARAIRWE